MLEDYKVAKLQVFFKQLCCVTSECVNLRKIMKTIVSMTAWGSFGSNNEACFFSILCQPLGE